jgi:8-oxo-dGTP diphosphatase
VTRAVVHVLVGLITDGAGRWLVNCRPQGAPLAGFWEFPGGKCEPGEDRYTALSRELDEELGIEVRVAEPLLTLEHEYADKRVLLDVWRVVHYGGEVTARERQELRWVTPDECEGLDLLEADWPIVERLRLLSL